MIQDINVINHNPLFSEDCLVEEGIDYRAGRAKVITTPPKYDINMARAEKYYVRLGQILSLSSYGILHDLEGMLFCISRSRVLVFVFIVGGLMSPSHSDQI